MYAARSHAGDLGVPEVEVELLQARELPDGRREVLGARVGDLGGPEVEAAQGWLSGVFSLHKKMKCLHKTLICSIRNH